MTDEVGRYLTDSYRRDILGESLEVGIPMADPATIADVRARIKWIEDLRLGANLAQRDFNLYQNLRALKTLLAQLEAANAADSQGQ